MAFYNIREAAIQDPNDIGVDLDQVEKDIAGPDGIEAHRDEIESAEEGMIGDPVEEAFNIMYESEYNYNQIMRCIGIHELNEAAYGRDFIFEAADIKGFFTKVKEFFVSMFKKITDVTKTVLSKLDFQVKADKKFVTKYKKEIDGGSKLEGWELEGYLFNKTIGLNTSAFETAGNTMFNNAKNQLDTITEDEDGKSASEVYARYAEIYSDFNFVSLVNQIFRDKGFKIEKENEFSKKYIEFLRGDKVTLNKDNISKIGDSVTGVLNSDRETKAIREDYKKIKSNFNETIKKIQELENKIKPNDKHSALKIRMCDLAISGNKTCKNILHIAYTANMKVARAKRAQYRALAHKFVSIYNKKNGEKKAEPQHNSAMFSFDIV